MSLTKDTAEELCLSSQRASDGQNTSISIGEWLLFLLPLSPPCLIASLHVDMARGHGAGHFSWAGDTSFLDSLPDQLHLSVTLVSLEEKNPSEELNDSMSHIELNIDLQPPPQMKWNQLLQPWEGLLPLTSPLSHWLPKPESFPFLVCSKEPSSPSHWNGYTHKSTLILKQ